MNLRATSEHTSRFPRSEPKASGDVMIFPRSEPKASGAFTKMERLDARIP
jgi:hypothetical protein